MIQPEIISNVLSKEDFDRIRLYFKDYIKDNDIGLDEFGRKSIGDAQASILKEYSDKLLPLAKSFFKSDSLVSSYNLFCEYCDKTVSLHKHRDANACTYTVDLVIYQDKPWGLWIEGKEYLAEENEAVFFWGEDQVHWRETIEDNKNIVGVIFFHYVEPDHWLFTKGPEHRLKVIESYKNESWFPK